MSFNLDKVKFEHNLEIFKENFPKIYVKISNFTTSKTKFIEKNFYFKELKAYPYDVKKFTNNLINNFFQITTKIIRRPSRPYPGNEFIFNQYLNKLFYLSPIKDKIDLLKNYKFNNLNDFKQYYMDNNTIIHIPFLILIGIGLGNYIEEILKNFNVYNLIIFEPELEMLYYSLYFVNWDKIVDYFKNDIKSFNLFLDPTPSKVIINSQEVNQMLVINSIFYQHYNNRKYKILKEVLDKDFLFSYNFGFYDDEKISLINTIENIKNKIPLLLKTSNESLQTPLFIIGGGPSLDSHIDLIKKYKDKAILFSCGSSISTLEKEGIFPDFHIEVERTKEQTYEFLNYLDKNYLKQITLITNNLVPYLTTTLFKKSFMFLKSCDTGAILFDDNIPRLEYCYPSVVNGALSLAINLGFKEIYLFGVDLGFKDPNYHHSKHNLAMDKQSKFYIKQEKKILELPEQNLYSTEFLQWTKNNIEYLLSIYKDIKVFNLSDGVNIENTKKISTDELESIFELKALKSDTLKLLSNFSTNYSNDIDTIITQFYTNLTSKIDTLLELLNTEINDKFELYPLFFKMYKVTENLILLKPTLSQYYFLIYETAFAETDNIKAKRFINQSFKVLKEFLYFVKEDISYS